MATMDLAESKERLKAMLGENGTWDLSPNDICAIRALLVSLDDAENGTARLSESVSKLLEENAELKKEIARLTPRVTTPDDPQTELERQKCEALLEDQIKKETEGFYTPEEPGWPWCDACRSYHHPNNPTCYLKAGFPPGYQPGERVDPIVTLLCNGERVNESTVYFMGSEEDEVGHRFTTFRCPRCDEVHRSRQG